MRFGKTGLYYSVRVPRANERCATRGARMAIFVDSSDPKEIKELFS
jgi:hypothetical protein